MPKMKSSGNKDRTSGKQRKKLESNSCMMFTTTVMRNLKKTVSSIPHLS